MTIASPQVEYIKLENRLVLLAWLNNMFGFSSNKELLNDMKQAGEGFDPDGHSFIYLRLISRGDKLGISVLDLERYDDNIRKHLATINQNRSEPIHLRYFQYLALLYSELFLDWRFNHHGELLKSLNQLVNERNGHKSFGEVPDPQFIETDLNKLAFWMATGSGKTLIMHVNYLQFLHLKHEKLDNILLITPNEGLTEQHMAEMTASNIPCERFNLEESGLRLFNRDAVRVIEITKLVEEKSGGGLSVPVEAFDGNNLIFVDEGHKGSGGEVWRKYRDALGATGFTFEYSATFGQALTAVRNEDLTKEYGKAIVFDYSYRYFYGDGFGKDFYILNLREETPEDKTELLLMGNLLSFYEQQRCFKNDAESLRPYNLEKPLWVFVGSSVNAVYTENRQKRSDVLTVARFLHHFLENRGNWVILALQSILDGKTNLVSGEDLFSHKFDYLRTLEKDPKVIYQGILESIFHTSVGGQLHIYEMRGKVGELGLKSNDSDDYFGLIYIGDTSAFKKLIEDDDAGIVLAEDAISDSLFNSINNPDTTINILIGAKKFMEGWNSWRVSNMGLLNIGRSEGSEIIQLFGRGVRLRGLDFSLKRSSAMDGQHPKYIPLLETLNIFAIRANYMAQFREYLEREGVETGGHVELPLAIKPNAEFLGKGLLIPRLPAGKTFITEDDMVLVPDKAIKVNLDISVKVQYMSSLSGDLRAVAVRTAYEQVIPNKSLDLIDWKAAYINLLEFKGEKGFTNLVIQPQIPRKLLEINNPRIYQLIADENVVKPRSFAEVSILQDTVQSILRKYTEKYYHVCQERWDTKNMYYGPLDASNPNFRNYVVRINRNETKLIAAVKQLIDESKTIYEAEVKALPNIYFDRHLYQPLLIERGDAIRSDPPGLNDGEQRFVRDVKKYLNQELGKALTSREIFLLRNLSRGKGIGFFQNVKFFPDFILWTKENDTQRIVFVEPHGMVWEKAYDLSDKAKLHERLNQLSESWGVKSSLQNVSLDSFIISSTPYDILRDLYENGKWSRKDFENKHILFPEPDVSYLKPIFGIKSIS